MEGLKTVIITGANSGLGFETAKKIAKHTDYRVILACRNKALAENARQHIITETTNDNVAVVMLDTSSLRSVRSFVSEFIKLQVKLDALVCNAGISPMHSGSTEDGFELVFATNYLGHFLLTNLLLPYMDEHAKIINITSDMHNPPGGIHWKDPELLAYPLCEDRKKYSYSKLCNIYFTYELDTKLRNIGSGITVNAFNPGMMNTNFSGSHADPARTNMIKLKMPERVGDLDKSSTALADLVVNDNFTDTGRYYDRSTNYVESSPLSYNTSNAKDLWEKSIRFTKLSTEETLGIV